MLALAAEGVAEGTWLIADVQTAGRGRQGRAWTSVAGNFHGSTLVRLRPTDPLAATLALVAGVALHDAATEFEPAGRLSLKWPNDLLLAGAKLAGVLLERSGDAVVVGIGVNLLHQPAQADHETAKLGGKVSPGDFLAQLAPLFARWLGHWRGDGVASTIQAWLGRAHPIGTALTVRVGDGEAIEGSFDGLAPDGALRLRLATGAVRAIHAADVFLV